MRYLPLVIPLGLAGCVTAQPVPIAVPLPPPQVHARPLKDLIPKSELVCTAEPAGASVKTERQAAEYIEDVRTAGRDCRRKLGVLRNIIIKEAR